MATRIKIGATVLGDLLADVAKMTGEDFDAENWTCYSSRYTRPVQKIGTIDCGVFVCAYSTLREQDIDTNLLYQVHNKHMRLDKATRL